MIFARVLGECLSEAGFPATTSEALQLGFGKHRDTLNAAIVARYGRPLPDGFIEAVRVRSAMALERELKPMPGVTELLAALPTARCVASTGHLVFFEPHVFSATQVAAGKPAPDLFLLAAQQLGVSPALCTVVEDSIFGVAAAVAAGMPVVGFCGGSHCRPDHASALLAAGCAQVFDRMSELSAFLCRAR